jgi:hypothetical protein
MGNLIPEAVFHTPAELVNSVLGAEQAHDMKECRLDDALKVHTS